MECGGWGELDELAASPNPSKRVAIDSNNLKFFFIVWISFKDTCFFVPGLSNSIKLHWRRTLVHNIIIEQSFKVLLFIAASVSY